MRDPARIDQVLDLLRQVWTRSPDLRLGQLLVNAVSPKGPCPEVYFIEDTVQARRLQRMLKQRPASPFSAVPRGLACDKPGPYPVQEKVGVALRRRTVLHRRESSKKTGRQSGGLSPLNLTALRGFSLSRGGKAAWAPA
jgi:hypothetical protein